MSKHTKGIWTYSRMRLTPMDKDRRSGFVVNGPDVADDLPVRICDLRVPQGIDGFAEGEANARLIAAAPEMLDALTTAEVTISEYRTSGHMTGWDLTLKEVRQAIAKATGATK